MGESPSRRAYALRAVVGYRGDGRALQPVVRPPNPAARHLLRCDNRWMEDHDAYEGPLGYVFAVADRPYCCWDYDHEARTFEFLEGLDTGYFETVASLLAEHLESSNQLAASVVLRVNYHQGIETLMSLLAASVQAPSAIPAWIASCKTDDLQDVVARLRDGRSILTQTGRVRVTFSDLAERTLRFAWADERGDDSTAALFGRLWERLSSDFLDVRARAEYNALKHGNRVSAGGFTLAFGIEETPGVAAPAEAMRSMGGSQFGSTFFVAERAGTSRSHIRTRRTSLNWTPILLARRLVLVSMSLRNVVGAVRCELGVDPASVNFVRPDPRSAFDNVWAGEPGVTSMAMDSVIRLDPSDELSKDELLELLERRKD